MKQSLLVLILAVIAMTTTSCQSISPWVKQNVTPEMLGRDLTVAYLLTKKKLEPKHVEAIKKTYEVFSTVITTVETDDSTAIKALIIKELNKAIEDPDVKGYAHAAIDIYWSKLTERFKVEAIAANESYKILRKFHVGIESALRDYNYLR